MWDEFTVAAEIGPGDVATTILAGRTDNVLAAGAHVEVLLDDSELRRAARFRFPSDRADFLAAHLLARACVGAMLHLPATSIDLVQRCAACGGEHGRPMVVGRPDTHVSWAHARGYAAVAAASVPVGVDVEVLGATSVTADLAEMVLGATGAATILAGADPERAFLRQWTRRECLVKLGLITLDRIGTLALADPPDLPRESKPRWQSWRDDLRLLEWSATDPRALGAVVLLVGRDEQPA